MAATRITAALRDHVVGALLRHRSNVEELELTEAAKAVDDLEIKMSELGYELVFTEAERRVLERAPAGWFPLYDSALVQVEGVTSLGSTSTRRSPFPAPPTTSGE